MKWGLNECPVPICVEVCCRLLTSVIVAVGVEELRDGMFERPCIRGSSNVAVEDAVESDVATVVSVSVFVVLVDDISGEIDAGEEPLVPGVGEESCVCGFRR